ncbi:uncharacterized protein LOC143540864 isoform X2 [Bidens hawaiensis]|uniref:uncharacterized protein LOC143540864 isoform X2 n=1 Tax=Bidens hawaiensis TaxID=980011 RepID=UPI00404A25DC
MVEAGLRVIPAYANKWFSEMIENGKVVECEPILTKMGEKDPKPDSTSYEIVIRALCAASNYDTSLSLLQQMVSYGVGVGPVLKEHVMDVFDKVGHWGDIDRILNAMVPGYAANVGNESGYRYGYNQQSNSGNGYVNRQQYNTRNTQQYDNGNGQPRYDNRSSTGNGQQYNNGNGQPQYNNRSYKPQYNNRSYTGNDQQYSNGSWNRNGQQYGNGSWNGNGQGYSNGQQNGSRLHYGNWQQNGSDQQVINGEQGYEQQPQTGSVGL